MRAKPLLLLLVALIAAGACEFTGPTAHMPGVEKPGAATTKKFNTRSTSTVTIRTVGTT